MRAARATTLAGRAVVLAVAAAVAVAGPAVAAPAGAPGVRAVTGCPEPTFWQTVFGTEPTCDPASPGATPSQPPATTDAPDAGGAGEGDRAESGTTVPDAPAAPGASAPATEPPPAPADDGAPVFTAEPAILSSDGLQIEGLHGLAIVTVPLADGTTQRAIRIEADRIVIPGFQLDVPAGEGGLRNTATTLTVEGNVVVYTPSITGILADGTEHVIDTLSDPTPEALASLVRLRLPLTGMLADDIRYDDSHQATF
ncbi:hypothetical protein ACWKWP_13545 [Agromyces soli]